VCQKSTAFLGGGGKSLSMDILLLSKRRVLFMLSPANRKKTLEMEIV